MAKALDAAIIKATNKLRYDQIKPEQQITLVEKFVQVEKCLAFSLLDLGKACALVPAFSV